VVDKSRYTLEELDAIFALLESATRVTRFSMVDHDTEIRLSRTASGAFTDPTSAVTPPPTAALLPVTGEDGQHQAPVPTTIIKSPAVGTFFRGPGPGAEPFIKVGTTVWPDTIICNIKIIRDVMALSAATTGVVGAVLVDDGEPIEFGQSLVTIEPLG
jgi:acetyl-CoA carboxylase biotin carboxyl carrier protein